MAKFLIVYGLEFLIGLTLITQVIYPLFSSNVKFFWIFKNSEKSNITELDTLSTIAEKNRTEREQIKENLSSAEEKLKEIKSKTN